MRTTTKVLALAGFIIGIGGEATAQNPGAAPRAPQGGPRGGPPGAAVAPRGPGNVTAILNARRALDLTSRQVVQLDSIERALHAERERVAERTRPAMDSLRQRIRTEGVPRDESQRAALRAQAEERRAAMRPEMERLRQRDSVASAAADRILNDTQRTKWREMQAERRGFERGMRAGAVRERGMRDGRGRPQGMPGRAPNGAPQEMRRAPQDGQPAPGRRP